MEHFKLYYCDSDCFRYSNIVERRKHHFFEIFPNIENSTAAKKGRKKLALDFQYLCDHVSPACQHWLSIDYHHIYVLSDGHDIARDDSEKRSDEQLNQL